MTPAPDAVDAPRGRRPVVTDVLVGFAVLIAAASVVVRLMGLSRQSYWVDELFSVSQASGSLGNLWRMGSTEVHPPTFAVVAWLWEHAGHSLRPGWMRLLPALAGAAVPLMTHRMLRPLRLDRLTHAVLVAATSACGLGLVYAQDMRSYSPLFLTAIGVTAASLRVRASVPHTAPDSTLRTEPDPGASVEPSSAVRPVTSAASRPGASAASRPGTSAASRPVASPGSRPGKSTALASWTLWAFLAASLHLFGGLLAAATAIILLRGRPRAHRRPMWRALLVAELPQVLWIVPGALRPGFSRGAGWIQAPHPRDAWLLLTSTFGVGRLSLRADGFPLAAPWGVLTVALLGAGAWLLGRRSRDASPVETGRQYQSSRPLLGFLARLLVGFTVPLFLVSQLLHLWTLRNMIVIAPALVWLAVLGVLRLVTQPMHRQLVAAGLLLCSAGQLVGTTHAMQAPYKSQFAPAMERAAQLRAQYPGLQVHQSGVTEQWLFASRLPATDAEFTRIMGDASSLDDPTRAPAAPVGVATLYMAYTSTHSPSAPADAALLQHNRSGCHAEPFVSVAFVVCAP